MIHVSGWQNKRKREISHGNIVAYKIMLFLFVIFTLFYPVCRNRYAWIHSTWVIGTPYKIMVAEAASHYRCIRTGNRRRGKENSWQKRRRTAYMIETVASRSRCQSSSRRQRRTQAHRRTNGWWHRKWHWHGWLLLLYTYSSYKTWVRSWLWKIALWPTPPPAVFSFSFFLFYTNTFCIQGQTLRTSTKREQLNKKNNNNNTNSNSNNNNSNRIKPRQGQQDGDALVPLMTAIHGPGLGGRGMG